MNVRIVPFDDSRHHEAFRRLNEEWIKNLFGKVEDADHYEFDHPVENIINKGGYIFIALLNDEPVGTFAMMRSKNPAYDYELVKYSVSPKAQGHGIGRKLMEACLAQARRTEATGFSLKATASAPRQCTSMRNTDSAICR